MTPLLGGAEAAREDGLPLRPHEGQHPTYSNRRPLCRAVCTSHQQQCQLAEGGHAAHPAGQELHVCGGDYATRGHNFYISQEAPA